MPTENVLDCLISQPAKPKAPIRERDKLHTIEHNRYQPLILDCQVAEKIAAQAGRIKEEKKTFATIGRKLDQCCNTFPKHQV